MKTWLALLSILLAGCGGDGDAADSPDAAVVGPPDAASFARGPSARAEAAVVYDPTSHKLLVFGGDQGAVSAQMPMPDVLGDSWILDVAAGSWHQVQGGPSARARTTAVYDPNQKRALIFGGRFRARGTTGAYTLFAEVWAFSFADERWSMISTNGAEPSRRFTAAGGYDAMTDRFFVFGGNSSTSGAIFQPLSDLYSVNARTGDWTTITPSNAPPTPRHFAQYAFDEGRRRLVVFSGNGAGFFDPSAPDTWAYDVAANAWMQLDPGTATSPFARFGGAMVYDKDRDRMLLFGGHHNEPRQGDIGNETWQLNLADSRWTKLRMGDTFNAQRCSNGEPLGLDYTTPDRMSPERRFKHGLMLDPAGARIIVVGGESDCAKLDDVWQLPLTGDPVWSRLTRASQGEGCVRAGLPCLCYCS